jgi:hypothetical protein
MAGVKKLKPAQKGLIIRDPITKAPLSDKGELKPWVGREGSFWRRRVKDKSAIIVEEEIILPKEDNNKKKKKGGK